MRLYWRARDLSGVPVVAVVNGVYTIETVLFDLEDVEMLEHDGMSAIRGHGLVVANKWMPNSEGYHRPYVEPGGETAAQWEMSRAEVVLLFENAADRDRVVRACGDGEPPRCTHLDYPAGVPPTKRCVLAACHEGPHRYPELGWMDGGKPYHTMTVDEQLAFHRGQQP